VPYAAQRSPQEFDFMREARLTRIIAARLAGAGVRGVAVPEPLLALSTPRMLVMQRMAGTCPSVIGQCTENFTSTSWAARLHG
jgi:predicted unusual protein kinase regulating ubiquinone biosynthesis (AarF/ABC1/UbiB family)